MSPTMKPKCSYTKSATKWTVKLASPIYVFYASDAPVENDSRLDLAVPSFESCARTGEAFKAAI